LALHWHWSGRRRRRPSRAGSRSTSPHTAVFWKVSHGGFSTVSSQFRKIDLVVITFDPDDVANSRVKASIEAASLDSNHYYRDNFTHSERFLNAREFMHITFESSAIAQTGESTGTMTGELDVTYNKTGEHLSGKVGFRHRCLHPVGRRRGRDPDRGRRHPRQEGRLMRPTSGARPGIVSRAQ
jgi:hypothetical protein